jgi:hypothetical protein
MTAIILTPAQRDQIVEALEDAWDKLPCELSHKTGAALTLLRSLEPQEPCAWIKVDGLDHRYATLMPPAYVDATPLYAAPKEN